MTVPVRTPIRARSLCPVGPAIAGLTGHDDHGGGAARPPRPGYLDGGEPAGPGGTAYPGGPGYPAEPPYPADAGPACSAGAGFAGYMVLLFASIALWWGGS